MGELQKNKIKLCVYFQGETISDARTTSTLWENYKKIYGGKRQYTRILQRTNIQVQSFQDMFFVARLGGVSLEQICDKIVCIIRKIYRMGSSQGKRK